MGIITPGTMPTNVHPMKKCPPWVNNIAYQLLVAQSGNCSWDIGCPKPKSGGHRHYYRRNKCTPRLDIYLQQIELICTQDGIFNYSQFKLLIKMAIKKKVLWLILLSVIFFFHSMQWKWIWSQLSSLSLWQWRSLWCHDRSVSWVLCFWVAHWCF